MSEAPNSPINAALAELQMQLPMVSKDQTASVPTKTGGSYRYTYANLARISEAVLPLLGKLGLSFTARPTLHEGRFVLIYELRHVSGEAIAGEYPLPERGTPQEIGGTITYARRYTLCSVTGVAPDDDDDAQAAEKAAQRRERREDARARQGTAPTGDSPMNGDQQRRMQKAFQSLGIVDKAEKLTRARKVVGRPLNSATELTHVEAEKVIADLTGEAQQRVKVQAAGQSGTDQPGRESADDQEAWLASQQPPEGVGEPS